MQLYHLTTKKCAELIVKNGFKDSKGNYGIYSSNNKPCILTGVFFSDKVLEFLQNGDGRDELDSVFVLKIPGDEIKNYEIFEESKGFREWCIPSKIVNQYFKDKTIFHINNEALYPAQQHTIPLHKLSKKISREKLKELLSNHEC